MEEGGTASSRYEYHTDGTPCEVKVSCTVWVRGKSEDDFKGLPIGINNTIDVEFAQRAIEEWGAYAVTLWDSNSISKAAVDTAMKYLNHETTEQMIEVPYLMATKENIAELYESSQIIYSQDEKGRKFMVDGDLIP